MDSVAKQQLRGAVDANLLTHFTWIQHHTEGMTVVWHSDVVYTVSGLPSNRFNAACGARFVGATAEHRIRDTKQWFAERSVPLAWWIFLNDQPADLSSYLLRAGFGLADRQVAMAVDLTILSPATDSVKLSPVTTQPMLRGFVDISTAGQSPPDSSAGRFYSEAAGALLSAESPCRFFLGMIGEEPAAALQLTFGPDRTVGCYNLATLPRYRGRGIARSLLSQALWLARAEGATVGVLQATEGEHHRYRSLGFFDVGTIEEYL